MSVEFNSQFEMHNAEFNSQFEMRNAGFNSQFEMRNAEFNSQFEMRNAQLFVKVVLYYNDDKLLQCENSRSRVMDSDRALMPHYALRIPN